MTVCQTYNHSVVIEGFVCDVIISIHVESAIFEISSVAKCLYMKMVYSKTSLQINNFQHGNITRYTII